MDGERASEVSSIFAWMQKYARPDDDSVSA